MLISKDRSKTEKSPAHGGIKEVQTFSATEANALKSSTFERTVWILTNLIVMIHLEILHFWRIYIYIEILIGFFFQGKQVEVQVKNGERYEGVLHTVTTTEGLGVVLKMARKKTQKVEEVITTKPIETLLILPTDFVQIAAKDVSFDLNKPEKGWKSVFCGR